MAFCDDGDSYVFELPESISLLKELWYREDVAKVAHNLKFEYHHSLQLGIIPSGPLHDTMILHQLLFNLDRHGLDLAVKQFCTMEDADRWDKLDKAVDKARSIYNKDYSKIPKSVLHPYQHADVERTALLFGALYPQVKRDEYLFSDYLNEIELIKATAHMERTGIMVDQKEAGKMLTWMANEKEDAQVSIRKIVGRPIKVSSPKQLTHLLYDEYKLPIQYKFDKEKKRNKITTDKEAIENLAILSKHPVLDAILKLRSYEKGIAMVSSYLEKMDEKGILHPNINTNGAATGRETSSDPNMQNVSKDVSFRSRYPIPARRCFRVRPGSIILSFDYKAIEMVLGVMGSGSERLTKMVINDFDFHAAMAESFYGDRFRNADKDTKKLLRNKAKNGARFPMFYGAGPATVSKGVGLPLEETLVGIERDKEEFPELYAFMDECTTFAKEHGWIKTFFGRKLWTDTRKPYIATDYKIQGSAAGVLKRAQVRLDRWLMEEFNDKIRILLTVHDQFLIEYPRDLLWDREAIVKNIIFLMTDMPEITIPLKVDVEMTTTTWDRAKEYQYEETKK
jgi:DNA polymerase-1